VFLNPSMSAALDRIAERAADVRRAYTPGAMPERSDVATPAADSQFTLDPLSAAAPDGAYFASLDARGRTGYSRDGTFRIADGRLVDSQGRAILGRRESGATLSELRIDPVDAALGRAADVRVEVDGSLVYSRAAVDPRTGSRAAHDVVVGRIALARFPAGSKLDTVDGRVFSAPDGIVPHAGLPGDGTFAALAPMRRERSRVDLDESLSRLKDAYVAFDALAAAQTARDRFNKTAMDVVK
jgi:flagellar basal body rod protein FlgG